MKRILLLTATLLISVITACSSDVRQPSVTPSPSSTASESISTGGIDAHWLPIPSPSVATATTAGIIPALRAEMRLRKLYWNIWCDSDRGEPERYQAIATRRSHFDFYAEEGAGPYWSGQGFSSKEEAALWLLSAIQEAPNHAPHKKTEKADACQDSIEGGPGLEPARE